MLFILRRMTTKFLMVSVCLGMLLPVGDSLGSPLQERTIKKLSWPNEPVKITKLKVKGKSIELNKKFLEEEEDWLRTFVVSVKNTSSKTIVYLEIELFFPRPKDSSQERGSHDRIMYGHYPPPPGEVGTLHPDQPPIEPHGERDIKLNDYAGLREFLNQTHYPASIKEIEIMVGEVIFDDGTRWDGGNTYRRDPANPNRWNRIGQINNNSTRNAQHSGFDFMKAVFEKKDVKGTCQFVKAKSRAIVTHDDLCPCKKNP